MNNLQLVTRESARESGLSRFYTGVACNQGHKAERLESSGRCVQCIAVRRTKYRSENAEKVSEARRLYDAGRREIVNQKASDWRRANPDKVAGSLRKWREQNQAEIAAYQRTRKEERNLSNRKRRKQRRKNDPLFALEQVVRGRLGRVFRTRGFRKEGSTAEMLGCTWPEMKVHIEKQFLKGMTWKNRGTAWHVDHIRPLAEAETADDLRALCHFTNLRPLWADENRKKNAKRLHLI